MKKKITAIALVVCLVAVAVVGGSLAYFIDEEEATNTFTVGNVDITLTEPNWTSTGSQDAPEVYPGEPLAKDPVQPLWSGFFCLLWLRRFRQLRHGYAELPGQGQQIFHIRRRGVGLPLADCLPANAQSGPQLLLGDSQTFSMHTDALPQRHRRNTSFFCFQDTTDVRKWLPPRCQISVAAVEKAGKGRKFTSFLPPGRHRAAAFDPPPSSRTILPLQGPDGRKRRFLPGPEL